MLIRKFAQILRGTATPFQLMAACIIGAGIGFIPGLEAMAWQTPGLVVFWLSVLLILNANLAVAGLVAVGAKAISFALLPVSFAIGRVLLEGPTEGIFAAAVNAPVLAWFGLEYYAVAGGQLLGILLGFTAGVVLVQSVTAFRKKMMDLGENSDRFKKYSEKKSVKFMTWLLIGKGHGKKTYQEILDAKANPIRIIGVVFSLMLVGFVFLVAQFASGPIVTAALQRGLEQANGATVDLRAASLDLSENKLELEGLALADATELSTDLFRTERMTADLAGMDLLRKRLTLDLVVADDASHGEQRGVPGVLIGPGPEPGPPASEGEDGEGGKTIDDYLAEAEVWKERLAQLRRWLEKIGGDGETPEDQAESREERIELEIRDLGYALVRADHLVQGSPTLLIKRLEVRTLTAAQTPDELFDIEGDNLSTHPALVDEPVSLKLSSRSGRFSVDLGANAASGDATARLALLGFDVDGFTSGLGSGSPLSGGTFDVRADGSISLAGRPRIALPLEVTLNNSSVTIPGSDPQPVESFTLPIGVNGPLDNPSLSITDDAVRQALIDAGRVELAGQLGEEATKLLDDAGIDTEAAEEIKDRVGGALGNLLGGDKKDGG
ncbi:MAG: hypothetical protein AAGB51_07470 [Planctomycetota bacterium]